MELPQELQAIEGARQLYDWFGYWPRFHDAEVLSLHLNTGGPSSLVLHTWEMTKEVDERGYYVLAKHVIVKFVIEEIVELDLDGFSQGNILFGLEIEKTSEGFRLSFDATYGMSGEMVVTGVSIRLTPGMPV